MFRLTYIFVFSYLAAFAQEVNKSKNNLAVEGYDLVTYFTEESPAMGKKEFQVNYKEVIYWFSSFANQEKFIASPSKYLPKYGGWCAYAMARGEQVNINPTAYLITEGELYLFYKTLWVNTLPKWVNDSKSLQSKANKNWERILSEN